MIKLFAISLITLFFISDVQGQLEEYKTMFLQDHALLQTASLDIEYAELEYLKSKRDRLPTVVWSAEYNFRHGGREYEIPTGTLLNGVYNNLSYLNQSDYPENAIYPESYPLVENTNINFLRTKEYDSNIQVTLPIINSTIYNNIKARQLEQNLNFLKRDQLKVREWNSFLIRYFTYFKRLEVIKIIESNNKKTSLFHDKLNSLVNNNKLIEHRKNKVALELMRNNIELKEEYATVDGEKRKLLDLLNKEQSYEILLDEAYVDTYKLPYSKEEIVNIWLKNNINLKLLNQRSSLMKHQIKQPRSNYKPSLNLIFRGGVQGEDLNFNDQPVYLIGALNFNWNLYNPKKKMEDKQVEIIAKKNVLENQNIEKNTSHEIQDLYDKILLEKDKLEFNEQQIEFTNQSKKEIEEKLSVGKASEFDLYDVQMELDIAKKNYVQAKYDYIILICQLEKLIGVDLINN